MDEWCKQLTVKVEKVVSEYEELKDHIDNANNGCDSELAIAIIARMEKKIRKIMNR